ncbi:MAG TPA: hypothetical protein PK020_23260, partial [Ilumatobacteraceae bacterium]|nr:hypothetical protein [Ilumatobacteraceae bacterium]
ADTVLAQGIDITSRFSPTVFVDIATVTRTETGWVDLAATFDGYAENGSFEAADVIWKSVTARIHNGLPCQL